MRIRVLLVAVAVLAAACGSDDGDGTADAPTTTASSADATATSESAPATSAAAPTTAAPTTAAPTTAAPTTVPAAPCDGGGIGTGLTSEVLVSGGLSYDFQVFVPSSYDNSAVPLVMDFHGLGSDGPGQSSFSEYQALALKEGFIVVNPTGIPGEGDDRNSWELAQFDVEGRDDVQMASDLIDRVAEMACIDLTRVYATGLSNGGFFSALLVCELSDRIAATFSVAAISHPDGCEPSRPVAMGAIHGTADEVVRYDGGGSVLLTDEAAEAGFDEFFDQVMPDEAAEFAVDFLCATITDEEIGPDTTLRRYTDCEGGVEVRFYTVEGGGHTWPGSSLAVVYESALGYATPDIDATEDGWAFMSQYSLPG